MTAFVAVDDRRRAGGPAAITYWLYRPTLGWERVRRTASAAEVAALAMTPLLETDIPALVAAGDAAGRNHIDFARGRGAAVALAGRERLSG